MGMYDHVHCEYPLPDAAMQNSDFQTKDMDCELKSYTITREGKLVKAEYETEDCPEEERPYFGKPEWEEFEFYKLIGCIRTVAGSERDVVIPFDGDLHFHDYKDDVWWKFRATFRDGRVTEMKRIAPPIPSPATPVTNPTTGPDVARKD